MKPFCYFFLAISVANLWVFNLCWAEAPPDIVGKFAYSEVMDFDSDEDRQLERVQYWASFKIRESSGTPGSKDFIPEKGEISFYLVDVDTMEPVMDSPKFTMGDIHAFEKPSRLQNIRIEGNTVSFQAGGATYTLKDGGPGYELDRFIVDDGKNQREIKMYDGNITIKTNEK